MALNKKNNRVAFIGVFSAITFFIVILVYELLVHNTNFGLKSIMGNSVTTSFYYCEDSSYTLKGDKCSKISTASASVLGDVNGDGKIDETDYDNLKQYLDKKITLNEEQLVAADVNSDGIISVGDSENIRLYVLGYVNDGESIKNIGTLSVCPKKYKLTNGMCLFEDVVNAKIANYKKGDINLDGIIDKQDINTLNKFLKKQTNLTTVQLNVADYNSNGIIDINDLNALEEYLNEDNNKTSNSVGDINLDGTVNSNDVTLLNKYVNANIKLKDEQLKYADINGDENINSDDVTSLAKQISSFYQIGDINLNGSIDIEDLAMLQDATNSVIKLDLVQMNLIDINSDGTYDNNDLIAFRNRIVGNIKYKKGDINMDGRVLADDVTIIENYILNITNLTIDQLTLADINQDGTIDNNDANKLAKTVYSNYESGDINMDGTVNMLDVKLLNNYLSKIVDLDTVQKLLADINQDGKVNASDLLQN